MRISSFNAVATPIAFGAQRSVARAVRFGDGPENYYDERKAEEGETASDKAARLKNATDNDNKDFSEDVPPPVVLNELSDGK